MLIVDAHLDLSWNALQWNRDLQQPAAAIRAAEQGQSGHGAGQGTVSLPDMRRGRVALCFATLIARSTDCTCDCACPEGCTFVPTSGPPHGHVSCGAAARFKPGTDFFRKSRPIRPQWSERASSNSCLPADVEGPPGYVPCFIDVRHHVYLCHPRRRNCAGVRAASIKRPGSPGPCRHCSPSSITWRRSCWCPPSPWSSR